MHRSQRIAIFVTALAVALAFALPVQAAQLYRYRSVDGGLVIASSVPNDRVPLGYEVLDRNTGRLLRTVAPQLTPVEAAAKADFERRLALCEVAQRRVKTMYESDGDIDGAEAQAIESVETRIVNAQANLIHVRKQRDQFQEQAARMERNGQGVNAILVGNIERTQTQIASLEQEIVQRRQEQERIGIEYERDRVMFELGPCEQAAGHQLFDPSDQDQPGPDQVGQTAR